MYDFLPLDLQRFLNWYLNPRARMARGLFNLVVVLALVPATIVQVNTATQKVANVAHDAAPLMGLLGNVMNDMQNGSAEGVLSRLEDSRSSAHRVVGEFHLDGRAPKHEPGLFEGFRLAGLLTFIFMLSLIPAVHMRLRDVGKTTPTQLWTYTVLMYAAVVFEGIHVIFRFDVPMILSAPASVASFFTLAWLCMAGSVHTRPPSERMPPYTPPQ